MSYYYQSKFIVTHHALVRFKQRVKGFKEESDLIAEAKLKEILDRKDWEFTDAYYYYYPLGKDGNKRIYALVTKTNYLVVTIKPMSPEKRIYY
ncbi:hypothetical protein [Ureaplasma ceti]|uniref:DUF4258 domain-containing protein n=1 Tax=Ureaplasma ceti TaxID=3119530 RepID=A0ABP9U6W8_9BACT